MFGQGTTGQITGRITDPSDASIPGAVVTVKNAQTQGTWHSTSNADGLYTVPQLSPGLYDIVITKEGFTSAARRGIRLAVDQIANVNFSLTVGSVSQTVEVSGESPLLSTTNPTVGEVIGNQQVEGLPLNGRSPYRLVLQTPGVHAAPSANGQFGDIPVNTTDDTLISIGGGPASANEVMIDGIPTTTGFMNQMTTIPSVDATQEFSVQSGPLKAEWGQNGGGVINVYTKSGTNNLHGDAYEFLRNNILDANDYFDKLNGVPTPSFKMNQFGFTAGGPVFIPKVIHGKDKYFFFVDYQGTRWIQGQTYIATVPTKAQRAGDFSQSLDSKGNVIQIFNPFSTTPDPNNPSQSIRTAFANNQIPQGMISPVATAAMTYLPLPNLPGNPITGAQNFISNAPRRIDEAEFGVKFDQSVGTKEKLFERYSLNRNTLGQPDSFGGPGTPGVGALGKLRLYNYSAGVNSTTTLGPSSVLNISYGFARFYWGRPTLSYGFDQSKLGFPSSLVSKAAYPLFPNFGIAGFSGIGGGGGLLFTGQNTHSIQVSLMRLSGRHSLKFGVDLRLNLFNQIQGGDANGSYSFAQAMTAGPNPNSFASNAGSAWASFLLGTAASGSMGIPVGMALENMYFSGYGQDDFRITPKLTLSYGLRYDATSPMTDRHNRLNWFDYNLPSPARNSQFSSLTGGLVFASSSNRSVYGWSMNDIQPRFGFAFNPITHTVIRGGIGLTYMPLALNLPGAGIGAAPQSGFSADTPMVASLDGLTPFNTLSNPFPGGLNQPSGTSLGASTYLGQSVNIWNPNPQMPNEWQWNFGIQQQVKGILIDLLYQGSKGTHLVQPLEHNALPTQDFALGTGLQKLVPNPFYGTITTGALAQPTVAQRQLLLPNPQFSGINMLDDTFGSSSYHALALKVKVPDRHGVSASLSYTFSKEIANVLNSLGNYNNPINAGLTTGVQNPYDLRAERSLSELDTPQDVSVNYVAEIPLGKGRRFLSNAHGIENWLVGGWQSNGIFTYRSGFPLAMSATIIGGGNRPNKTCSGSLSHTSRAQEVSKWFDTSCFVVPAPFTFGNESRTDPRLRSPSFTQFDTALEKHHKIENMDVMLRAEAFNLFNTIHFYAPDSNANHLTFGQIQSTTGTPRVIQFALKLSF
ncbi:MAG TPA: carboxypeptidase regulatory-like domain-containing protein [Terracidiphilus sp.]|nr:carboxypeptidase regulatory-like domain-containing protein [Terracidiphilus sp.]